MVVGYVVGVSNDDGDDWDPRRHRDPERSLLEGADGIRVGSRALGSDDDRQAVLGQLLHLLQTVYRGCRIVPVDEGGIDDLAYEPGDGVTLELLLAHRGPVLPD